MITNQRITVAFQRGEVQFDHLTRKGDLTELFALGNEYRILNKKRAINFTLFMNSNATKEFLSVIGENKEVDPDTLVQHNGKKGKASRTFADLHFLIYVATQLDTQFQYEVIDTFIDNRLLDLRDDGGNEFKALNKAIDKLEDRTKALKPNGNKGCYINVAKMVRTAIFSETSILKHGNNANIWNTSVANTDTSAKREEIEKEMILLINRGYIKTYPQLKEAITRL